MDVSLDTKNPFSTVKDQNIRYSSEKVKPRDDMVDRQAQERVERLQRMVNDANHEKSEL